LLRVLQEKKIVRIGSNKPVPIDCRIIVATHRDLFKEVKEGRFREDLYYRLFGLTIEMPPLRNRNKDIILLAEYFVNQFSKNNGKPVPEIHSDAKKKLMTHNYPGNVRELRSVMELATVMSDGKEILADDINFRKNDELYEPPLEGLTQREHTYNIIKLYLKKHDDNIKEAARELDISYSTIYRILKKEE
jgi:DNA-binding NtrC family response regulator